MPESNTNCNPKINSGYRTHLAKRSFTMVEYSPEAVLYGVPEKIKIHETIDRHVPKVWGVPVSVHVEILVINRFIVLKTKTEIPILYNLTNPSESWESGNLRKSANRC